MADVTGVLTPNQALLWQQYLFAEAEGIRPRFLSALSDFIGALREDTQEQRNNFAQIFCRQAADRGEILPLREPLFAGIIGPYLVSAYQNGDSNAGRWIAHYYRFFIIPSARNALAGIGLPSPMKLLEEAFRRSPDDALTQDALVQEFMDRFRYTVHEVPSGVLYTANGATVAECKEWQKDLALFEEVVRRRGLDEKYEMEIREWDFHFRGYADYLTHREQYQSYGDYISRHWQE